MAFGSAAWRCALQTLHAVVSKRGSESGLGGRVPEILQPGQENTPVDAVPRTTAVELSSQANALHSSHMSSAALPTPRQRSFAGLAILGRGGGGMEKRACCVSGQGWAWLLQGAPRVVDGGESNLSTTRQKRVREDKRLEGERV